MAVVKKYTQSLVTHVTPEWRKRIQAVADHERTQVSLAEVVRDCIETALPGFELALGIRKIADLDPEEIRELGLEHLVEEPKPVKEDRSLGSFGAPPKPKG